MKSAHDIRTTRDIKSVRWCAHLTGPSLPLLAGPSLLRRIGPRLGDVQRRLQGAALAAVDNGVLITDIEGRILWVNAAFTRLTGYTAQEAIGRTPRLLKSGKHDRSVYTRLWDTILSGQVWRGQLINRRKDGSLHTEEQTITPVRDEHGMVSHFVAIKHDITARTEAEEEVRRLNDELEERVRQRTAELTVVNRELETFSSSVSHDLRAPLRSIDSFSKALLEDYAERLDEHGQDYLRRVRAASQRMQELIDDLLHLARVARTEMQRQKIDLGAVAQTVAAELREADPPRRVEFVIPPRLVAYGDARLLRVALENLLQNAWKYTSKHPAARIEFGMTEHSGAPAFFVRDDGAGFDMHYAQKLFAPFQRLHARTEFEGTGIGLAIVQRIIHRHGGSIWAEGAVERGATFYFTLGARGGGAEPNPLPPVPDPARSDGPGYTIR